MSLDPSAQPEKATFDQIKGQIVSALTKLIKRTRKQVVIKENILQTCQQWAKTHHQALLIQSNLYRLKKGISKITVFDWEQEGKEVFLFLDRLKEPKDQVDVLFKKARKLRLGVPHSEKQLQLIEDILIAQEQASEELQKISTQEELDVFLQLHPSLSPNARQLMSAKKKEPQKPYHVYASESGLAIWVGKNAKNNDTLTFHYANGSDWWLHAHNYPGSHVVIRNKSKLATPDQGSVRDAAELALRYSKAKHAHEEEVTVSQVKYFTEDQRVSRKGAGVQASRDACSIRSSSLEPVEGER
jgi:predicted ribosome quality control (RQC) complex YloA/Tae2 family protein